MFDNYKIVINLQVRVAVCKQSFQSEDLYNIATRFAWCKDPIAQDPIAQDK